MLVENALEPKTSIKGLAAIIGASSVGTLIEWYDFYIFGSLATIISTQFFPKDNPTAAFLSTLATFAAGFVVRPFGALFFGRLGDLIGRKYTFMVTLVLMGGATFAIGLVPKFETIGYFAPFLVLVLGYYKVLHSAVNTEVQLLMWLNTHQKDNEDFGLLGFR